MKKQAAFIFFLCLPLLATAQFEQKISINLSGGIFSTFGAKTYMPEWGSSDEDMEPHQIANYRPGVHANLGFQLNINRSFSIQANIGVMYSGSWYYNIYDGVNYTSFAVWDTITDDLLAEGHNELSILNLGIGVTPKYYLSPGKKLNPYLFGGLTLNITTTEFVHNEWLAIRDAGYLDPDDSGPDRANIEKNIGMGFNTGIGLEYSLNDKVGFYMESGYYLILLKKENFYVPEQKEHFHAITLQAGLRLSFAKSKEF